MTEKTSTMASPRMRGVVRVGRERGDQLEHSNSQTAEVVKLSLPKSSVKPHPDVVTDYGTLTLVDGSNKRGRPADNVLTHITRPRNAAGWLLERLRTLSDHDRVHDIRKLTPPKAGAEVRYTPKAHNVSSTAMVTAVPMDLRGEGESAHTFRYVFKPNGRFTHSPQPIRAVVRWEVSPRVRARATGSAAVTPTAASASASWSARYSYGGQSVGRRGGSAWSKVGSSGKSETRELAVGAVLGGKAGSEDGKASHEGSGSLSFSAKGSTSKSTQTSVVPAGTWHHDNDTLGVGSMVVTPQGPLRSEEIRLECTALSQAVIDAGPPPTDGALVGWTQQRDQARAEVAFNPQWTASVRIYKSEPAPNSSRTAHDRELTELLGEPGEGHRWVRKHAKVARTAWLQRLRPWGVGLIATLLLGTGFLPIGPFLGTQPADPPTTSAVAPAPETSEATAPEATAPEPLPPLVAPTESAPPHEGPPIVTEFGPAPEPSALTSALDPHASGVPADSAPEGAPPEAAPSESAPSEAAPAESAPSGSAVEPSEGTEAAPEATTTIKSVDSPGTIRVTRTCVEPGLAAVYAEASGFEIETTIQLHMGTSGTVLSSDGERPAQGEFTTELTAGPQTIEGVGSNGEYFYGELPGC